MKSLVAPLTAALALSLAGCGDDAPEAVVVPVAAEASRTTPPPARAAGTLSRIADVDAGHRRIGYVNAAALADFGGALSVGTLAELVLEDAGARRLAGADPAPATAVQVGDATVLDGASRSIVGGSSALRTTLTETAPPASLITDETPSAVQSCLADGAAEVIVGSAVMGRSAAIGVGLLRSEDPPAGRKLLICAAPHFVRQLDPTIARLRAAFDDASLPAGARPKIGEADIGERDIVTAAIPFDTLSPREVRTLLSGGSALTSLTGD